MSRARMRSVGAGALGLLAIAGGTITAAPTWANNQYTVINNAGTDPRATIIFGSTDCTGACTQGGAWDDAGGITFSLGYLPASWDPMFYTGGYGRVSALIVPPLYGPDNWAGTSTWNQHFVFEGTPYVPSNSAGVGGDTASMECEVLGSGPLQPYPVYAPKGDENGSFTCTLGPAATKTKSASGSKLRKVTVAQRVADTRVTTNVAYVKNGKARVRMTANSMKRFKVAERVTLRNGKGKVIGRTTARITTGKRSYVKVDLPAHVRKKVKAGKWVQVSVHVTHADGTRGTGHKFDSLNLRIKK